MIYYWVSCILHHVCILSIAKANSVIITANIYCTDLLCTFAQTDPFINNPASNFVLHISVYLRVLESSNTQWVYN